MNRLDLKRFQRKQRKIRVRKKISGTPERPRLTVSKSNRNLSVQIIDDVNGKTLASASTLEKELKKIARTVEGGAELGKVIAERMKSAGINTVVFDRNGYPFHGIIKAIADGAREAGIVV